MFVLSQQEIKTSENGYETPVGAPEKQVFETFKDAKAAFEETDPKGTFMLELSSRGGLLTMKGVNYTAEVYEENDTDTYDAILHKAYSYNDYCKDYS